MRRNWSVVACLFLATLWILLRISAFSFSDLIEFSDSPSYLAKAQQPLWTRDFFFGSGRFFVVPLIYKFATAAHGTATSSLAQAQVLVSLGAWIAFGWSLASRVRAQWMRVAAMTAALAFGASTDVIQWDSVILSESISTSLFVVLVASWIRLGDRMTYARVAGVVLCALLWSFSREANSLLVLPLAAALALWALWYADNRHDRMCSALVAAGLVGSFLVTAAVSGSGDRWVFPLLNVIGTRVLPSPVRSAWYQQHGMPMNERLRAMSGEYGGGQDLAFYSAPELAGFRSWLNAHGKRVFLKDLATHPARTLVEPLADVGEFVCPLLLQYRQYQNARVSTIYFDVEGLPLCRPHPTFPETLAFRTLLAGSGAVGLTLLILAFSWRRRLTAADAFQQLTVSAMLIGWLPFTWFTWQVIGGMEISRHVWSGVLMCRMGVFLLCVFLVQTSRPALASLQRPPSARQAPTR